MRSPRVSVVGPSPNWRRCARSGNATHLVALHHRRTCCTWACPAMRRRARDQDVGPERAWGNASSVMARQHRCVPSAKTCARDLCHLCSAHLARLRPISLKVLHHQQSPRRRPLGTPSSACRGGRGYIARQPFALECKRVLHNLRGRGTPNPRCRSDARPCKAQRRFRCESRRPLCTQGHRGRCC